MANPLDDAFEKAKAEREAEARAKFDREQAEQAVIRQWLPEYREVLETLPRYVSRAPEEITLAWLPEVEPPSPVRQAGTGRDRQGSSLSFGTCEAWLFARLDEKSESWTQFFVSSDCAALFTTERFGTVRRSLRRGRVAQTLGPFVDVRTGRHTLSLSASVGSGDQLFHVWHADLPSPEAVAKVIAEQELSRRR